MRLLGTVFVLALVLVALPAGGAAQEADVTNPEIVCGSADGNWHAADAVVSCTASDSESGLFDPLDASFDLTTDVAPGEENADAATGSRQVCDVAGNCATAGPILSNQVDKKAPLVVCATATLPWHGSNVTISCTASDGGSGLADIAQANVSLSTNVLDGSETANASTESTGVCDVIGNCAQAGPVGGNKVDRKDSHDPTTVRSTDHRLDRWSRDARIDMFWTGASDGGSGVDGFSYSWTQHSGSEPDQTKNKEQGAHTATSQGLSTGKWWFHIRTRDNVGNWTSTEHRGPYLIDITRPQVKALSASGKTDRKITLRYRTADNTHRTRERITVSRSGSTVASWSKGFGSAFWGTTQSVSWTPHSAGSYSLCVEAFDPAGNSRRDCAGISVTNPAPPAAKCDPSYPGVCIPPPPPDLDCGDVPYTNFTVVGSDPHGFDGDGDGVGCES
jgi:hypothetical protein